MKPLLKLLGAELRGIFDPLYLFFIVLANPAASYGECARRIQGIIFNFLKHFYIFTAYL